MGTMRAGNPLLQQQVRHNLTTAANWELFAPHRQRVSNLILSAADGEASRLCVLGAGNCNDIDLAALTDRFEKVHLVDLDEGALRRGVSRSVSINSDALVLHTGIDVTGILADLGRWLNQGPSEADIGACIRQAAKRPKFSRPQKFDVVASCCLLTQLISSVINSIGATHARALDLVLAVRTGHVNFMIEMLAPGGSGVLISDLVASDTCDKLLDINEGDLTTLMCQLLNDKNFFTGVNPFALLSYIHRQCQGAEGAVRDVSLKRPWLWRVGLRRTYLVYAITFRRS